MVFLYKKLCNLVAQDVFSFKKNTVYVKLTPAPLFAGALCYRAKQVKHLKGCIGRIHGGLHHIHRLQSCSQPHPTAWALPQLGPPIKAYRVSLNGFSPCDLGCAAKAGPFRLVMLRGWRQPPAASKTGGERRGGGAMAATAAEGVAATALRAVLGRAGMAAERSGRAAEVVRVVAVGKTKPVSMLRQLYDAGHRCFGENYVQEFVTKAPQVLSGLHFDCFVRFLHLCSASIVWRWSGGK
jgi:hypothetical protein